MLESNGSAGDSEGPGAEGERGFAVPARGLSAGVPDPELVERAKRRRFTAEYKLKVLREADACTRPGEIGALLRREGLYSSLLTEWRRARDAGSLEALERPRGRPKADPRDAEIARLRRRAERAETELVKARKVIEVQGNVSALLGELLEPRDVQLSPPGRNSTVQGGALQQFYGTPRGVPFPPCNIPVTPDDTLALIPPALRMTLGTQTATQTGSGFLNVPIGEVGGRIRTVGVCNDRPAP